jgi:hypothetical protein
LLLDNLVVDHHTGEAADVNDDIAILIAPDLGVHLGDVAFGNCQVVAWTAANAENGAIQQDSSRWLVTVFDDQGRGGVFTSAGRDFEKIARGREFLG